MALNSVNLQGKLGADPELRYTSAGTPVCKFSIACAQQFTKDGVKKEKVYWGTIIAWGKLAEIAGQYLSKGKECIVEGSLQSSEFEKNGQKVKVTEVLAEKIHFTSAAKGGKKKEEEGDIPF